MQRRTLPLPAWSWEQLEAALNALPQTQAGRRMTQHHLAGLQADQPGMTSSQLLLEILSLAAMVTEQATTESPQDGTDPLLGPSLGEC